MMCAYMNEWMRARIALILVEFRGARAPSGRSGERPDDYSLANI